MFMHHTNKPGSSMLPENNNTPKKNVHDVIETLFVLHVVINTQVCNIVYPVVVVFIVHVTHSHTPFRRQRKTFLLNEGKNNPSFNNTLYTYTDLTGSS